MGFFDAFTGSAQRKDLRRAEKKRDQALTAGKATARTEIGGGYTQAFNDLSPYDDKGAGYGLYRDSIGANGVEGYTRAKTNFDADPFLTGEQAAADNALMGIFKRYNAGGMGNSGANRAAVSRAAQERYGTNVANYRTRLAGLGQTGLGVAQTKAGLHTDRGNTLGNLEYGFGQQQANAATNFGNAMAASRSIGPNNLLGLLGAGTDLAGVVMGQPRR